MFHHIVAVVVLGMIAGITEFIPISSSAHVFVFSHLFHDLPVDPKLFSVLMQFCAICVVLLYHGRFWRHLLSGCLRGQVEAYRSVVKLLLAFLPIAVVGFVIAHWVHQYLFSFTVIGCALLIGGIVMLFVEHRLVKRHALLNEMAVLSYRQAFWIGCAQVIALIPGVSRSGATIVSALCLGAERSFAIRFSFSVAVPTLLSASLYELWKYRSQFIGLHMPWYLLGAVVTVVSAFCSVVFFIRYFSRRSLFWVAVYRMILGGTLLLITMY